MSVTFIAGFAKPEYTICGGLRCSVAQAYLRPALRRNPNLHVLYDAFVYRVRLSLLLTAGSFFSLRIYSQNLCI